MTTAEDWERFLEAGERFMAYMEADTARLADRLGVTVEDLNYFADTMDFEWLAKRVAEAEGVKVIEPGDGHGHPRRTSSLRHHRRDAAMTVRRTRFPGTDWA